MLIYCNLCNKPIGSTPSLLTADKDMVSASKEHAKSGTCLTAPLSAGEGDLRCRSK